VGGGGRGIIEAITIISFWMAANSIDLSGKLADYCRLQNIGWQKNVAHLANCHYIASHTIVQQQQNVHYCSVI
jgi:hypothetical protein